MMREEKVYERVPFQSLAIHELLAAKLITLDEFSHRKSFPLAPFIQPSPPLFCFSFFFHPKKLFH